MKVFLIKSTLLITTLILIYVWIGFLYEDSFSYSQISVVDLIIVLWLPRILFPIIIISFIVLILRYSKDLFEKITLLYVTLLVLMFLIYPVLEFRYAHINNKLLRNSSIHSYLQIAPINFENTDNNNLKIFCLGGSTTEYKDKNGIGWPKRLENLLKKEYKQVNVYNYGREWYSSQHSLINYQINLRKYKPKMMIVMHAINDLLHNADFSHLSRNKYREDYGHFFGPIARIIKKTNYLAFAWDIIKSNWYHKERRIIDTDNFPGLKAFERNINSLIDIAELDDTHVVLMTQPNLLRDSMTAKEKEICRMVNFEAIGAEEKWSFITANSAFKQYNSLIRKIALDRSVTFIDLASVLPKSRVYFSDEVHYNEKSYDIIAQYIFRQLVSSNILTARERK